jgi:hypothetical protein
MYKGELHMKYKITFKVDDEYVSKIFEADKVFQIDGCLYATVQDEDNHEVVIAIFNEWERAVKMREAEK